MATLYVGFYVTILSLFSLTSLCVIDAATTQASSAFAFLPSFSSCPSPSFSSKMKMSVGSTEKADLAKGRLRDALSSISGKLTVSSEIVIPDPTDPTALLLQATNVKKLSERLRTAAKANAAWISGSLESLRQIAAEQEEARGSFPGPLPVLYCPGNTASEDDSFLHEIADAGASGFLVSFQGGTDRVASTLNDLDDQGLDLRVLFEKATGYGLQPIPEVVLSGQVDWTEDDVSSVAEKVVEQCGMEPACLVLTVRFMEVKAEESDDAAQPSLLLPRVPKTLKKRIPILGSVAVAPGEGRMGQYMSLLKDAGYTGALLRADCVPGFRLNPDLEFVSQFWTSVISDLKSAKSKSFGFQTKMISESLKAPLEWAKYQNSVIESGALGETNFGDAVNSDAGDYKGF